MKLILIKFKWTKLRLGNQNDESDKCEKTEREQLEGSSGIEAEISMKII